MTTARLRFDPDEDEPGLAPVEFEILPRANEVVFLNFGERRGVFRVERVEHRFADANKVTLHLLLSTRFP